MRELVAILATGPSAPDDVSLLRESRIRTIVINDSYRLMPDAAALFASDAAWWQAHPEAENFAGERYVSEDQRIESAIFVPPTGPVCGGNSALRAVHLAHAQGAKTVLLLGVDLRDDELTHWHGQHRDAPGLVNPNADTFRRARKAWTAYADTYDRPDIINCNPRSGLECFRRMTLDDALLEVSGLCETA